MSGVERTRCARLAVAVAAIGAAFAASPAFADCAGWDPVGAVSRYGRAVDVPGASPSQPPPYRPAWTYPPAPGPLEVPPEHYAPGWRPPQPPVDGLAVAAFHKWRAGWDGGGPSADGGTPETLPLALEDAVNVNYTFFEIEGAEVPSRTCGPAKVASTGGLSYDPRGVAVANFAEYVAHLQETQPKLNDVGECTARAK